MASKTKTKRPAEKQQVPYFTLDYTLIDQEDAKEERKAPPALSSGSDTPHAATKPSTLAVTRLATRPFAKTFIIRMTRSGTLTTGGGVMALITLIPPSAMDQYTSQLASLFREVRLVNTRIQYNTLLTVTPTTPFVFDSVFDPAANSGSTSPGSCWRLEGAKRFTQHTFQGMRNRGPVEKNRPWSLTDASQSGQDPLGGISGGWIHNSVTATPSSTAVLTYLIEAWFEFRYQK